MSNDLAVLALAVAPWIAALFAAIAGRAGLSADAVARIASAVVGAGFIASVAAVPYVVASGSAQVGVGATTLRLDALAMILSMLVLGLSALIQTFAVRYLRGDSRQVWFVVSANLLTGFTVLMVCAGSVAVFAVGWVGAGAALLLLLATYWPLAQARDGVRRTGIRFFIADAAFLLAVTILLVANEGDVSLDQLGEVAGSLPGQAQLIVAALLVAAALARSSQIPFQGWLLFTLAAPTPVSALLHAGVVNAGAILLIRFAPAITQHQVVMITIFLAGAATLVYASTLRLVRPDVKGRLVFSTMAQMGFMIMACGLGLFTAAIFHLVAHALFKSALFLGAGTGVRHHAVERDLPTRARHSRSTIAVAVSVSLIVPLLALVAAKLVFSPTVTAASAGLLAFVVVTASVALASALITNFSVRTAVIGLVATFGLTFAYVGSLEVFTATLETAAAVNGAPAWLLVVPSLGLLAVELLARNPRPAARLRDLVYTHSLAATSSTPSLVRGVIS